MHKSYESLFKHPPDFKVKYHFYDKNEGGRNVSPVQGYRSDFSYTHNEHLANQLFMIYPEFEDVNGEIMLQTDIPVLRDGIARMWIANTKWRAYHKDKIKIGLIGYFMEGARKVAECEVIEIPGLLTNPT
jgi:hypothetical protein